MKHSVRGFRLGIAILFVALVFAGGLFAHADDSGQQVRAARLTSTQGSVTVIEPNNAASVPGQVNLPLLSGVQVQTGNDGQAEIEFEDGSVVRLTPNSVLSLDTLAIASDGVFVTDMSLSHGLAYCELRATQQYSFVVNAGGDMVSPVENLTVRVNFDQQPASFAVLDGTAEIERQSGAADGYKAQVRAGETLQPDSADDSRYFLTQSIASDSWDQWNADQDQAASAAASTTTSVRDNYAGADGYGWSDLDANGSWYNVPGEGEVWQPDIAATDTGFDPYGNGAWVYSGGTGYVWASGYTWGWTPYRCGNWSYYNQFGWGWAPGGGCGTGGWGFYGGGSLVNIGRFPPGYRPIRVPTPGGSGPRRPFLPIHTYVASQGQFGRPAPQIGQRTINGQLVSRIAPVQGVNRSGGPVTGSSLRRDYPVNAADHTHELGTRGNAPAADQTRQTPRQGAGNSVVPMQNGQPAGQAGYGNRNRQYPPAGSYQPQPANRPVQGSSATQPTVTPQIQQQRTVQSLPQRTAPYAGQAPQQQQRGYPPASPAPQQPQQQRSVPPAAQPPAQQQRYEQPPAQQRYEPHPSYSPPPQQQSRPSPPPPAPPRSSAPAQPSRPSPR